jgi:hypothetical protein
VADRVAAWKPVSDVVWGLWGLIQHADGNRTHDYQAYAAARFARASGFLRQ